jgi:hypothetical protein
MVEPAMRKIVNFTHATLDGDVDTRTSGRSRTPTRRCGSTAATSSQPPPERSKPSLAARFQRSSDRLEALEGLGDLRELTEERAAGVGIDAEAAEHLSRHGRGPAPKGVTGRRQ